MPRLLPTVAYNEFVWSVQLLFLAEGVLRECCCQREHIDSHKLMIHRIFVKIIDETARVCPLLSWNRHKAGSSGRAAHLLHWHDARRCGQSTCTARAYSLHKWTISTWNECRACRACWLGHGRPRRARWWRLAAKGCTASAPTNCSPYAAVYTVVVLDMQA